MTLWLYPLLSVSWSGICFHRTPLNPIDAISVHDIIFGHFGSFKSNVSRNMIPTNPPHLPNYINLNCGLNWKVLRSSMLERGRDYWKNIFMEWSHDKHFVKRLFPVTVESILFVAPFKNPVWQLKINIQRKCVSKCVSFTIDICTGNILFTLQVVNPWFLLIDNIPIIIFTKNNVDKLIVKSSVDNLRPLLTNA